MRKEDVTEKKNKWCFFFLHSRIYQSGSRREMQAKISIDVGSAISHNATNSFLASLIGHGGAGGVVRI